VFKKYSNNKEKYLNIKNNNKKKPEKKKNVTFLFIKIIYVLDKKLVPNNLK
jgi:hypothetical protein